MSFAVKWAILAVVVCGFCACAKYPQIALESFERESFSVQIAQNLYVLYVSSDSKAYHFALFDALGAPVASKILQNGTFSNAKFLPPNARYDEIFIESLRLLQRGESQKITADYTIKRVPNE